MSPQAHKAFLAGTLAALRPPTDVLVSVWSQKRRLSRESSAIPGYFVPFEYQIEPMDSVLDPLVSETVMDWAAQMAKSETTNNIIGYFMEEDPSPQIMVQPTIELGEEYSKDRIAPMIRDTPCLRELVKDPRSRDSGNTIKSKRYPGGSFVLVGANSAAGLAGRPRRVIIQDEIDRFPLSAGTEGDPCSLADKRAQSFPNAVKVKTSTPTIKGSSRIEKLLEKSDCRKWHCECPRCEHEQVFAWSQVRWHDDNPASAWLECISCRHKLTDEERVTAVRGGRWVATQPFRGVRGYWLNGINTLFPCHRGFANRLHQMAVEFLKAKEDGAEAMKVWVNTFLAESYEESSVKIDAEAIAGRVEEYEPEPLPAGVLVLTASADIQADRIEAEFVGWGRDEERWGLGKIVLSGDPTKDDGVWHRLDDLLLKEWETEGGAKVKVERALIDMGFANKRVLEFCGPRIGRGVYPCRGLNRVGTTPPPLLPAKPSRNNRARIPHWNVGVTVAKQTLYDRLLLAVPGPRSMHFCKENGYDADHFRQLTAEKLKKRFSYGQAYYIFEKDNTAVRNEAMDLWVYSYAALQTLYPLSWDSYEMNLKRKEEQASATKQGEGQPVRPVVRRGSWATRW